MDLGMLGEKGLPFRVVGELWVRRTGGLHELLGRLLVVPKSVHSPWLIPVKGLPRQAVHYRAEALKELEPEPLVVVVATEAQRETSTLENTQVFAVDR